MTSGHLIVKLTSQNHEICFFFLNLNENFDLHNQLLTISNHKLFILKWFFTVNLSTLSNGVWLRQDFNTSIYPYRLLKTWITNLVGLVGFPELLRNSSGFEAMQLPLCS